MFKGGCCFGGGRALTESPNLSDKRRLEPSSSSSKEEALNCNANGGATGGVVKSENVVEFKEQILDAPLAGVSPEGVNATAAANVAVVGGGNSTDQLPKDKADSNGI